jgi:uncharacterized protein
MSAEVELRDDIARLMELQAIDRRLQEVEQTLAAVAGRVEQLREENQKYEAELKRLTEDDQQSDSQRKKVERELAEGEARIRNKRMRLNLVRTDKELQAVTHEVDALKENNTRLEGELAAITESAAPRATRIKELGELIAKGRAELAAAEKEIAGEVEEIKSRLTKDRRERDRLVRDFDRALLQRYEMIFSRRAGLAVALVKSVNKDGKCTGCQRLLPPQVYYELQKNQQIHYCPNCQRILYYDAAQSDES